VIFRAQTATAPLFQKQRFRHRPEEGTYGDCHRTCIAALLGMDRDEVPHWGVHFADGDRFEAEARAFLASKGLRDIRIPIYAEEEPQQALNWMSRNNPGTYYLLTGKSRNGTNHVVICRNAEIVWDPALDDSGIVGSCEGSGWYWAEILAPITDLPVTVIEGGVA
jgi:hypothetical protein